MIQPTINYVNQEVLDFIASIEFDGKLSINKPTASFFYDPWQIKEEYAGTPIETALQQLPDNIGEARLIKLKSGTCYFAHSDIDDRYHLNISGDCAALVDLETKQNYFLQNDGVWYDMDAGRIHSAVNFGQYDRVQLVVRKLLHRNVLVNPVTINVIPQGENARFVFDNTLSPWLNRANKEGKINNFISNGMSIILSIDDDWIDDFVMTCPKNFRIEIL